MIGSMRSFRRRMPSATLVSRFMWVMKRETLIAKTKPGGTCSTHRATAGRLGSM